MLRNTSQLEDTRFGVLCLTPENLLAPWILFEAGALSKTLENTYVCPYLFDLDPTDLKGPLVQFQATKAQKEDTRKLVLTINEALRDERLSDVQVNKSFEVWWPKLEEKLASVSNTSEAQPQRRTERELLEEVLELVRNQVRGSLTTIPTITISREEHIRTIQEEVLALLKNETEGLTALEIAVRTKRSRPDTSRALNKLIEQSYLVRDFDESGIPLYRIH